MSTVDGTATPERESKKQLRDMYSHWRDALPPACAAMFELNRYAKYCSDPFEIYVLKNQLIELLYRDGACVACIAHERELPPQHCYDCRGSGDYGGDFCERCNGTGIFVPPRTVRDIAFSFRVGDKLFSWHQPEKLICFPYEVSATLPGEPARLKPLTMTADELSAGMSLVQYVLSGAVEEGVL